MIMVFMFVVHTNVYAFHHSSGLNKARYKVLSPLRRNVCLFSSTPVSSEHENSKMYEKKQLPLEDPSSFPKWAYEQRDFFRYELIHQSKKSQARVGRIHTPHGIIDCPGFVAVATNGALKGLDFRQADEAGQQLVFCNSYHLLLHPGPEVIEGKEMSCLRNFSGKRMWILGSQM